jgi:hypothetical protein
MVILDVEAQMVFGDAQALARFMFAHANLHQRYGALIQQKFGSQTPLFDLTDETAQREWGALMEAREDGEPKPSSDAIDTWLRMHDALHSAEIAALKIGTTSGLQSVDFSNEEQFYDWMNDHQQYHDLEDSALGL